MNRWVWSGKRVRELKGLMRSFRDVKAEGTIMVPCPTNDMITYENIQIRFGR